MDAAAYEELWIHRQMLSDQTRGKLYRRAFFEVIRPGDVVLDVGAGTGLLSLFAAQAGAKKVYAVERTRIAELAGQLIQLNGMAEVISLIRGEIESVELPEKADVIVSELLGPYGVDENMLPALALARDRWLKPGGRLVPEHVTSWLALLSDPEVEREIGIWRKRPYRFDLSPIALLTAQEAFYCRPKLTRENLLAEPQPLWSLDLYKCAIPAEGLALRAELSFTAGRAGTLSGLGAWFEARLSSEVQLQTGPGAAETHWGTSVFPLEAGIPVEQGRPVSTEFVCEPAARGYCHTRWACRVGNGAWEYHDTRRGLTR